MFSNLSRTLIMAGYMALGASAVATPLKVYILAGQSNMEGHAAVRTFDHLGMDPKTAPLLAEMRNPDGTPRVCEKVWISYLTGDGTVKQGPLTAGYGALGREPKIGPEFTFGITMQKQLDEPILLIKTAWGGKSLHTDFRPPSGATDEKPVGAYYRRMVDHVKAVLADIASVYPDYDAGQGYEVAGFVWFQGWNDMVASDIYPNRGKPGGYDLYSELLAHFIRDVRRDLAAPEMHFVIGVMGIDGVLDLDKPNRYTPIHDGFRKAMAAPAALPEFKGNVTAVLTELCWDTQLGELASRWDQVKAKSKALSKDERLTAAQRQVALETYQAELFTPEEMKVREVGISNAGFHYLGSAKIMAQIGKAFAEAMMPAVRPCAMEQEMFGTLQELKGERSFGHVGVTGLKLRIYEGLAITVEETMPGTPADGKFAPGERVAGVNGIALKGNNPFIVLGSALTAAEASDGKLVFDVQDAEATQTRQVTIQIPVLGAYSATWPLNCGKSKRIIAQAAAFYAETRTFADGGDDDKGDQLQSHGIGGALAGLFLLSTGEDKYLPRVKAYVDHLATDLKGIGDNTWNNGYNGILSAEYYLRTGDKSALPVIQYYCDNAKERQFFGVGWGHWGRSVNPGYVGGGLMNPAGAQVVTTLLLAKECGVKVDEPTLLGALRQWYRFVGHGTVPYGDHRPEGGLGSNGKDGMAAAMMQAACGAQGNVAIYKKARDYLSMSTVTSYPRLVAGHADNGRGDGIWRGMASAYMLDVAPDDYHAVMNHLRWWFDLSRRPGGGIGMSLGTRFDDVGSGAGLALAYTAPLKTLRITGAPLSKYAQPFELPEQLWGRKADLAFFSVEHGSPYWTFGPEEPVHVPLDLLGNAYGGAGDNLASVPRGAILRNVYHKRYMIRAQAGKALLRVGALDDLEKLLEDKDPRVRRAALDGLIDYRYWFAMGKDPIETAKVTPAMIASIRKMLADPDEALYVVDGALMALSRAPAREIMDSLALVRPWTRHEEWWLRQASFTALTGAGREDAFLPEVLPTLLEMMVRETRTQAREGMQNHVGRLLKTHKADSPIGQQLVAGLQRAVKESEIIPGLRSGEGAYNVIEAAATALREDPSSAVPMAGIIQTRFPQLATKQIAAVVGQLLPALRTLPDEERVELTTLLYGDYREELIRRMAKDDADAPLDTILALTQLRAPELDWEALGKIKPAERVWQFTSFEPQPKDALHPRVGKRFRDVDVPSGLEGWFTPDFDAAAWERGTAPVGKGIFKHKRRETVIANQSTWGAGEFLVMRTTFEMESLDYDYHRLLVLANQGFHVYLNGHKIHTYIWWKDDPAYRPIGLGPAEVQHLKPGTNVLAIYANAAYVDGVQVAQIDAYLEGLKKADLVGQGD